MRIWSLHPDYLDAKGLVAAWREALLAQKVLKGETKGYRNHPQLRRFKNQTDPVAAIGAYLRTIYRSAVERGYNFKVERIEGREFKGTIACTRGQLFYEWNHLKEKLKTRDPVRYRELENTETPKANPIFRIVSGEIEGWEIVKKDSQAENRANGISWTPVEDRGEHV